jgi:hypothetical protein
VLKPHRIGTHLDNGYRATVLRYDYPKQLLEFPRVDFGVPTQLFYAVSQFVLDITNLVGSTSSSSTGGIKSEKIGRDGLAYSYFQSKVSDTRASGSVASYLEPFFIKTFTLS